VSLDAPAPPATFAVRVRASLAPHWPALAAAGIGLAWFLLHVGPAVLDPRNVAWLMNGDWEQHYLGWAFFRRAPLALPLGANSIYPAPAGSTLGFTDSIPLVGVLLRPIAALLPSDFQYLGPWLALCFMLQGLLGAKLVKLATPHPATQAAGGALFTLAPPLLHRVVGPYTGHSSLSAHWLVLAFLWIALAPSARAPRRRLGAAAALLLATAGIHPYHVVMGAALSGALVLRLWLVDRALDARRAAVAAAAIPTLAAAGLLAFGYLSGGVERAAGGYGFFSADALALLAPMRWSRLWNGPGVGHGQYEGFGYLGAGALLAVLLALASAVARRGALAASRWRAALPALAAALALFLLSLSNQITIAGAPVLQFEAVGPFAFVASTFRSSGRFVWTLHYLVLFAALAALALAWRDRPRLVAASFAALLALQAVDVRPPAPFDAEAARWRPPSSELWGLARGRYRHVVLYPPYLLAGGAPVAPEACGAPAVGPDGHLPAAAVALQLGASFNSAYAARLDSAAAGRGCNELRRAVALGQLDPETLYFLTPRYLPTFAAANATCGEIDGLLACVRGGQREPFSDALRRFGN
jgi:hypothetical protein